MLQVAFRQARHDQARTRGYESWNYNGEDGDYFIHNIFVDDEKLNETLYILVWKTMFLMASLSFILQYELYIQTIGLTRIGRCMIPRRIAREYDCIAN